MADRRPTTDATPTTETPRDPETMTNHARQTETDRAPTARTDRTDRSDDRPTLRSISHTNPYTGRPFGTTQSFGRGATVAADGGEADAAPDEETLEDVDHTPADEAVDGTQGTFDRGRKGPDRGPDDE